MIWNKRRIYADAAAATPLSEAAKLELVRLLDMFGNPGALHKEAVLAKLELENARESVARSIGAHPDEIVFTSGGTEGNNLALCGTLHATHYSSPRHVITSVIEHSSVLEPLCALTSAGMEMTQLPVNSAGIISVDDLSDAITDHTALVSIQFINSEIGTIQPIRDIAKEVRRVRAQRLASKNFSPLYLHVDASQAPLWKTVQVDKLGVDLLTLDGQKIMGPKGVGVLYVRRGVKLVAQQLGGGQEGGLRSGTENVPLAGSFAAALKDAQANENEISKKIAAMRNILLQEILALLPKATVNGAVGDERVANNLNISIPGLDGEMAVIALDALGVAASTRSACDSSDEAPSHVLTALGLDSKIIKSAIRFTLLPTATKKDCVVIAKALLEVANRYRNMV